MTVFPTRPSSPLCAACGPDCAWSKLEPLPILWGSVTSPSDYAEVHLPEFPALVLLVRRGMK